MITINPKNPNTTWFNNFFPQDLLQAKAYSIDDSSTCNIKLDQNESPFDWPLQLKQQIISEMLNENWNRYPEAYPLKLSKQIATYAGVNPENILLCGGSNYHISVIINMVTQNKKGDLIIARPSFPLYESHCIYSGIKYIKWNLTNELTYDINFLNNIKPGSIVIFASPNNPIGNNLKKATLESLLIKNPNVYFIADEAYYEFCEETYTDLLLKYSNLVLIRTFSKAFSAAGIRLGYTIASKNFITELKKLTLPFIINRFAILSFTKALEDEKFLNIIKTNIKNIVLEKNKIYETIKNLLSSSNNTIYPSIANFLFLRSPSQQDMKYIFDKLQSNKCLVRPITCLPNIFGLRLTIGTKEENDILIKELKNIFC